MLVQFIEVRYNFDVINKLIGILLILQDYKGFQVPNIKWSSIAKLQRKYPLIDNETGNMESLANTNALELLICDVSNIIHHHVQCSNRLPK